MAKLQRLWDQLETAAPPHKPAIVKKIEAQSEIVDQRRAELDECIREHQPQPDPASQADVTLNIALDSNRASATLHESGVMRTFDFVGARNARKYRADEIVVERRSAIYTTTYTVSGIAGVLNRSTGAMTFTATVDIRLRNPTNELAHQILPVSLDSGRARSQTGLFTPQGSPVSAADFSFKLVGTGFSDGLEFQLIVDGVFAAAP